MRVEEQGDEEADRSANLQAMHFVAKSCLHRFPSLRQASGLLQLLLQTQDAPSEVIVFLLGLP